MSCDTTACEWCNSLMFRGRQAIVSNAYGEWCSMECFNKSETRGFKTIPDLVAELTALRERVEEFVGQVPPNGTHGGPMVRLVAHYEDGSEKTIRHEAVEALRKAEGGRG